MFDSLRRRISALIVGASLLVLTVLLCVVFVSEYASAQRRNWTMLDRYMDSYCLEEVPDEAEAPPDVPLGDGSDDYQLSSFYSVSFGASGEVLVVDEGLSRLYHREELVRMAGEVARQGADRGTTGSLLYEVERRDGYTLVAFVDNHLVSGGMRRLLANMLVGAGVTLLLIVILSLPLSRALVRPLEESDARQRRFVSDAGHELKTPISVIDVNAEVLARQIGESRWLDNIRHESQRMGELVLRLLRLSRAEEGVVSRQTIDLSQLVAAEAAPFEVVATERNLRLACSIEEGIRMQGDASQIAQLPAILLENALDYAQGGGDVTLTLRAEGPVAVLEVANPAGGLDAEVVDHAFERFFRADKARSASQEHLGLGLPIAKAIVEGHGGTMALTCLGETVHAVVRLPLHR